MRIDRAKLSFFQNLHAEQRSFLFNTVVALLNSISIYGAGKGIRSRFNNVIVFHQGLGLGFYISIWEAPALNEVGEHYR
jgi:hypothetical protein